MQNLEENRSRWEAMQNEELYRSSITATRDKVNAAAAAAAAAAENAGGEATTRAGEEDADTTDGDEEEDAGVGWSVMTHQMASIRTKRDPTHDDTFARFLHFLRFLHEQFALERTLCRATCEMC